MRFIQDANGNFLNIDQLVCIGVVPWYDKKTGEFELVASCTDGEDYILESHIRGEDNAEQMLLDVITQLENIDELDYAEKEVTENEQEGEATNIDGQAE